MPIQRSIDPIPIRTLALHFSLIHGAIPSTVIGCRSAKEVDEMCDAYVQNIPDAVWTEFDAKFGEDINNLK